MENPDIIQVARLADSMLELVSNLAEVSESELDGEIAKWTRVLNETTDDIGSSQKIQLLMEQFDLSKPSILFVLLTLLPALDSRYNDFYKVVSGNEDQTLPTIDLLGTLVSPTFMEKDGFNAQLRDDSPIFYWRMLLRVGEDFRTSQVIPGKSLTLHLAKEKMLTEDATGLVTFLTGKELDLPFDHPDETPSTAKLIAINGGFTVRQRSFAFDIAKSFNQPLFVLNDSLLKETKDQLNELKEALLFVVLNKGLLFWQDAMAFFEQQPDCVQIVKEWLQLKDTRLLTGETQFTRVPGLLQDIQAASIKLKPLDREMDLLLWKSVGEKYLGVTNIEYSTLNNSYYPDFSRIEETILQVQQQHHNDDAMPKTQNVVEAYLATSPMTLSGFGHRLESSITFEEMVLPEKTTDDLLDIEKAYLHRAALDPSQPTGLIALFEGATGTGKSLAATCLAKKLGIPIYKVDYSQVKMACNQSEKSVKSFFKEAERTSAFLLFDEADALFTTTEKPQASDAIRSSLIDALESYGGLIVFTTSQKPNIDPNLLTRVLREVSFPEIKPALQYSLFIQMLAKMNVKIKDKDQLQEVVNNLGANGSQIQHMVKNAVLSAQPGHVPLEELEVTAGDLANAIEMEQQKTKQQSK